MCTHRVSDCVPSEYRVNVYQLSTTGQGRVDVYQVGTLYVCVRERVKSECVPSEYIVCVCVRESEK